MTLKVDAATLSPSAAALRLPIASLQVGVVTLQVGVAGLQVAVVTLQVAVARLQVAVARLQVGVASLQVAVARLQVGVVILQVGVAGLQVGAGSLVISIFTRDSWQSMAKRPISGRAGRVRYVAIAISFEKTLGGLSTTVEKGWSNSVYFLLLTAHNYCLVFFTCFSLPPYSLLIIAAEFTAALPSSQ